MSSRKAIAVRASRRRSARAARSRGCSRPETCATSRGARRTSTCGMRRRRRSGTRRRSTRSIVRRAWRGRGTSPRVMHSTPSSSCRDSSGRIPYPQMTALDGVVSCSGMEYPMITCIGGQRDTLALYSVTVHEFGHMWFPMQVGSDEKRHAWQDEGLTRFNQAQAMRSFFGGYDLERIVRDAYLGFARTRRRGGAHASRRSVPRGDAGVQRGELPEDGDEHGRAPRAARGRRVHEGVPRVRTSLDQASIRRRTTSSTRSTT